MEDIARVYWRKPKEVKRSYADTKYGQIHYRHSGDRKSLKHPLLMLHQSPSSGRPFEGLLARLGKERLVIAVDTPGFGDSDVPQNIPTINDYALAIIDFIDLMNLDRLNLFGDHTGAKIAVEIVKICPSRINKLIFNSCPVYSDEQMSKMKLHLEDEKPKSFIPEDGSHFVERWISLQKWYEDAPIELINRDFIEMQRPLDKGWYGHNAAFAVNHADNLPKIFHPILVLCPNDMLWDATKASENYFNNGRILELPEYGMGSLSVETEMYEKIFVNFLDDEQHLVEKTTDQQIVTSIHQLKEKNLIRKVFVDTPFGQIHVRISGENNKENTNRPLLCLHMSPFSSKNFEELIKVIGRDRLVFAMDIPGFGESDPPEKESTIYSLSEAILSAIQVLTNQIPFDILGDHTGAVLGIHIAAYNQNFVKKLVLNGIPCFETQERKKRLDATQYNKPCLDGSHLFKRWKSVKILSGQEANDKLVERNFVEALKGGPFAHWGHKAVFSYDLESSLKKVSQPTLVFRPRDGLESATEKYFTKLKNGILNDLPHEGYGFFEFNPKEYSQKIIDFLGNG